MTFARRIWLAAAWLAAGCAGPVREGPVAADLIADVAAIAPGQPFTIAFRMKLDSHWHTYWTNPGDSGLAPSLEWSLPIGFTAGEMQVPHPIAIATPPFMTYGHEGEVLYLFSITPPGDLPDGDVTFSAEANWLVCHDMCIPGQATLELTLPVRQGPAKPHRAHAAKIAAARKRLPADPGGWRFEAAQGDGRYLLYAVPPDDQTADIPSATFFPYAPDVIQHAAPQTWRREGEQYVLEIVPADPASPPPEKLSGVLVASEPWFANRFIRALRVDASFSEDSPRLTNPERNTP